MLLRNSGIQQHLSCQCAHQAYVAYSIFTCLAFFEK